MDLVCGDDDRRILVSGGGRGQARVGRRSVPRVAHGLDEVQLAVLLDLVAQAVEQDPGPGGLVEGRAGKDKDQLASKRRVLFFLFWYPDTVEGDSAGE